MTMTFVAKLTAAGWLLLLALLGACGDQERVAAEAGITSRGPARAACITRLLAERARTDLAALDSVLPGRSSEDPVARIQLQAARAAYEYARAYEQLAGLRASAAAYVDSAVNYSRTPADSARYAQLASGFRIRAPEPGTLEANVAEAYARSFVALANDEDHRCNWDTEA
jgi:multidrug efflux pump subunit AcrA (membrane-fusion protein)